MSTKALITRSLQLAARPFVLLLAFLKNVALSRFNHAHPLITASGIIAIILFSCGAAWTLRWYQHRPKPRYVSVMVERIPVTKLEKELTFPTLDIQFGDSAARL